MNRDVIDFIKTRHQYVGGHATNDAMLSLNQLSNDDKHKTLIEIGSAFAQVKIAWSSYAAAPLRSATPRSDLLQRRVQ